MTNLSLASFPGMRHDSAMVLASQLLKSGDLHEPAIGAISIDHVQIVPQCFGMVNDALIDWFKTNFPETQFRLHANVRVLQGHVFADLSNFEDHPQWWEKAAQMHKLLGAKAYSAHSGRRSDCDSLEKLFDNCRKASDLFGCDVAIEGQYPSKENYQIDSWGEYRQLFESGLAYALDLSHLNIVATQSQSFDMGLVKEMLSSDRCSEVHLSDNNGKGDFHQVCNKQCWWSELLDFVHPSATIFTEGNHRKKIAA